MHIPRVHCYEYLQKLILMSANKICCLNCLHFLSTCTKQETLFVTQSRLASVLPDAAAAAARPAGHPGRVPDGVAEAVSSALWYELI